MRIKIKSNQKSKASDSLICESLVDLISNQKRIENQAGSSSGRWIIFFLINVI